MSDTPAKQSSRQQKKELEQRENREHWLAEERKIGELCSATFAPSLGTGIGVGYLAPEAWEAGTRVVVEIHGQRVAAETVRGAFRENAV